jgi:hypothetical protein
MDCGKLDEAEEAFGGFVVARRDAAKLLQQTHHALDAVAPCIAAAVRRARRFAVRLPRNNGARAAQIQLRAQAVGARILCRREARAGGSGQARSGPGRPRCRPPVRASDGWREAGRSPRSRRGSWLRTRHGTGPRHSNESPFSGPGAVLVRPNYGAVDHLDREVACTACHQGLEDSLVDLGVPPSREPAPDRVPFAVRSGRSRQGEPVRAIQKIPSRMRRLSIAGRHARPRSGGRNGASSPQVASSMMSRSKAGSHFPALNHADGPMGIPFVHTA